MAYDVMLLADPGPERERVLSVLRDAGDIRPDPRLEHRFWLTTAQGEVRVNIGTKDPVESIHLETDALAVPLLEAVARRALELADTLEMRVEDVQWGHELTWSNLPELLTYAQRLAARPSPSHAGAGAAARPWWRFW
jgi:hypothetical protein